MTRQEELVFFSIYDKVGNLLENNIQDIDTNRKSNRWIFPTFTTDYKNNPSITIKIDGRQYSTESAGNYLKEDTVNDVHKVYYFKQCKAKLRIYVITNKDTFFTVMFNGQEMYLTGKLSNAFIANNIKFFNISGNGRSQYKDFFDSFKFESIDLTYENSKTTWASELVHSISYKDIWVDEYVDGQLIKSYSLDVTTTLI